MKHKMSVEIKTPTVETNQYKAKRHEMTDIVFPCTCACNGSDQCSYLNDAYVVGDERLTQHIMNDIHRLDPPIRRGDLICVIPNAYRDDGLYIWDGEKPLAMNRDQPHGLIPSQFKVTKDGPFTPDTWQYMTVYGGCHFDNLIIEMIRFDTNVEVSDEEDLHGERDPPATSIDIQGRTWWVECGRDVDPEEFNQQATSGRYRFTVEDDIITIHAIRWLGR